MSKEQQLVPIQRSQIKPERASGRAGRLMAYTWPVALTLVAQVIALWAYASAAHFQRITDFISIGRRFATPLGISSLAFSYWGYDGQFFYYMARFPLQVPPGSFDTPTERYSRMLYPALVRAFSLGTVELMPWVALLINLLAIAGTVALFVWLLRQRGLPVWLALVPGLYCGQVLGLLRDLTDPLLVFWLALALVGLQQRWWLLTAAALALGLLTRETMLPFILCFAVPLVVERRWDWLVTYVAVAFAPYLAWQQFLYAWLGHWGLIETLSNPSNALLHIPFKGLDAAPNLHTLIEFMIFACVPAVAGIAGGLLALRERPWHDPLRLAAALAALVFGAAFTLQPQAHWLDIWAPMRLAAPLAVLLPLLATPRWLRYGWQALLALLIFSFAIALGPAPPI
jgi:hypothetical protein